MTRVQAPQWASSAWPGALDLGVIWCGGAEVEICTEKVPAKMPTPAILEGKAQLLGKDTPASQELVLGIKSH